MNDFNNFDKVGNGLDDEARFRPIHRETLPVIITGGVRVDRSNKMTRGVKFKEIFKSPAVSSRLLAHSEVAVFENGEESSIHALCVRARTNSIVELASKMHKLLGLPLETVYMELSVAWLRDTIDQYIDHDGIGENDHWRWSRRYPRLSEIAKANYTEFQKFQKMVSKFIIIPDLTKPHKTALEIKKQRDKDFAKLRIEFDLQHPGLKTA